MEERDVPGVHRYDEPAGGWGALGPRPRRSPSRCTSPRRRRAAAQEQARRLRLPGCAWPDKEHTSTFQFCENGAKAVTWEATKKRVTPEFFAAHTVTELLQQSDTSWRTRPPDPSDGL